MILYAHTVYIYYTASLIAHNIQPAYTKLRIAKSNAAHCGKRNKTYGNAKPDTFTGVVIFLDAVHDPFKLAQTHRCRFMKLLRWCIYLSRRPQYTYIQRATHRYL